MKRFNLSLQEPLDPKLIWKDVIWLHPPHAVELVRSLQTANTLSLAVTVKISSWKGCKSNLYTSVWDLRASRNLDYSGRNAAALCEAPEMFLWTMKLHLTFHQHEGETIMAECFIFLCELFL